MPKDRTICDAKYKNLENVSLIHRNNYFLRRSIKKESLYGNTLLQDKMIDVRVPSEDDYVYRVSRDSKYIDMKNVSLSNRHVARVKLRDKNSLYGGNLLQQRLLDVCVPPVDDDVENPGNTAVASGNTMIPCHSKPQGRTSCDAKYKNMENVSSSIGHVANAETGYSYPLRRPIKKDSLNGDILLEQRMLDVCVPPEDDDVYTVSCDSEYIDMKNVSHSNRRVVVVKSRYSCYLKAPVKKDSQYEDIILQQRMLDVCVPPADDDVYTMSCDSEYIDMKNVSHGNRRVVVVEPRYSCHLNPPDKKNSQYEDIILQQIMLDVCVPPGDDGVCRASCDSKYTNLENVSLSNDYLVWVDPRYSCPLEPLIMKVSQYDDIILQQRMLDVCVPPADDDVEIPGNTATASEDSVIPCHSKPQGRTNCDTKDTNREHASSNNSRS